MLFASYTYLPDADALAMKAYLFSLKPIDAPAIANTFAFPFDQRWAMGIWAAMFNADRRFEPHADRSAEWTVGAYLVEALAHCGRMPYAAQSVSGAGQSAQIASPEDGALTTSQATRRAASANGANRR